MRLLFSLCLIAGCLMSHGQNITYKDLTSILSKSNWEHVNQYLLNKGWEYHESVEQKVGYYGSITWSYQKSDFDDKAVGWINLYISYDKPVKVSFQFHKKGVYNTIKNALIASGMKRYNSNVEDDMLETHYSNRSYTAVMRTSKSENTYNVLSASYSIVLEKKMIQNYSTYNSSAIDTTDAITIDTTISFDAPASILSGIVREEDGSDYTLYTYKNGRRNGIAKTYNSDDVLLSELTYKNDVLNGPFKYYEDGKLVETGVYINEKLNGTYKRYDNGRISVTGIYVDDKEEGQHTIYNYPEEGEKDVLPTRSVGLIKNGKKHGVWKDIMKIANKDVTYGYATYCLFR